MVYTHRDMYEEVIRSGKYQGAIKKIERLAQLIYNNDRTQGKKEAAWQALEKYEEMTGNYYDPTQDQFDSITSSII